MPIEINGGYGTLIGDELLEEELEELLLLDVMVLVVVGLYG